jgi:hypothetical protein
MSQGGSITLVRRYSVGIDDVWAAWTTAEAVAAWWGPRGFVTTVTELDLRSGGSFGYEMTAKAPELLRFMDANQLPHSTVVVGYFQNVLHLNHLTIVQRVDFVPGIDPYETSAHLTLRPVTGQIGCRSRLVLDRMHDDEWTERSLDGWRGQLRRLANYVRRR